MNENIIFATTKQLISQQLGFDSEKATDETQLEQTLAKFVSFLLENRLEQLFSGLYRLDVDEQKVKFALSTLATEPADLAIARLIIARQRQKAITRLLYQSDEKDEFFS